MKKTMLFFAALLFSISAHAATLNLTENFAMGASQGVTLNNNSTVLASGTVSNAGNWFSLFDLTTTQDTPVKVEWKFNPTSSLESAQLVFGQVDGFGGAYIGLPEIFNITGDFAFASFLTAGSVFAVDILNATSDVLNYNLSISAVPIPATLFLFAPAIFGFLALRRKAFKNANALVTA